jgi:hypothetical protein
LKSAKKYEILPISSSFVFGEHPGCNDHIPLAARATFGVRRFAARFAGRSDIGRQFSDAGSAARQVIDLGSWAGDREGEYRKLSAARPVDTKTRL